ncbi:MAG: hypothetical protein QXL54_00780, partial [Candidatus Bathyarchaeia archaeon]
KLGLKEIFTDYMEMTSLNTVDKALIEEKLKLFKTLWDEMYFTFKQNNQTVEKAHFKVKTSLSYYFNPTFMQGVILRTTSIINAKNFAEAAHYLDSIFLSMLENYAWLKSAMEKQRVDYTTLVRTMENLEKTNPKTYQNVVKLLKLADINKTKVNETVEKARKNIAKLRRERKRLIKTHISKS